MKAWLATASAAALAGCTWVTPNPNAMGSTIVTLGNADIPRCQNLVQNQLTVADKLGMLQRMPGDVENDLQTMAINQAASVGANGVSALSTVSGGTQTWGLYKCPAGMKVTAVSAATSAPAATTAPAAATGVKTIPYNPPR